VPRSSYSRQGGPPVSCPPRAAIVGQAIQVGARKADHTIQFREGRPGEPCRGDGRDLRRAGECGDELPGIHLNVLRLGPTSPKAHPMSLTLGGSPGAAEQTLYGRVRPILLKNSVSRHERYFACRVFRARISGNFPSSPTETFQVRRTLSGGSPLGTWRSNCAISREIFCPCAETEFFNRIDPKRTLGVASSPAPAAASFRLVPARSGAIVNLPVMQRDARSPPDSLGLMRTR
jgi:hypothetical protein